MTQQDDKRYPHIGAWHCRYHNAKIELLRDLQEKGRPFLVSLKT